MVSWFGAMQAQDYKGMRWAVEMRTCRPSFKAFKKAFDQGRIIRTHMLRTTWQLVSAQDYHWMLELCRSNALRGLRGWMHSNGTDIPDYERRHIQELLAGEMEGKVSFLKEDLNQILIQKGIKMEEHRLSYHLRLAEYDGLMCSGDLHPTNRTLALVSDKIGEGPRMDRDQALALLTRKYFRSHAPASLEDFVWWSGINVGECRKGIALLGDELVPVRFRKQDYYLHRDARTRGSSAQRTIQMWPSVRRGEEENIFPFQESADATFNSALIYELAVLKQFAEPLLYSVPVDSPEHLEAKRLLKFFEYFLGISSERLPFNSIAREFVGGSIFNV